MYYGFVVFHFSKNEIFSINIRILFAGRHVIVQAQSGMGKTATYVIAMLQQLDEDLKDCQGLILVPTRELAKGV
jgi:superfamily II DNA/RNA helicase